mmetsp:Transcript_820/g.2408  ORF Transcript_820/g.2408 Transcript_820/m.2408 type:complete len:547 (-) Transcript_820:188-1828(-)
MQSTTGPGQDSFFEYLLKGYILFDDVEMLDIFWKSYSAIEQHQTFEGFTYNVDMFRGHISNTHLSPLSCVWASVQILAGDVAGALRTVLYWYGLWLKHGALPEVFDTKTEAPTSVRDSPLRPELAEAVFYLSLAMPDDPTIFGIAKNLITALNAQSRVECGYAAVADVTTKRLDDRMDSFFLSETLVYLYLAVAPRDQVQKALGLPLGEVVFSTEGHIFPLSKASLRGGTLLNLAARRAGDASAAEGGVREMQVGTPGASYERLDLYPGVPQRPLLTCEALSPFERVALQHRCQTKYFLTASYHMQSLSLSPSKCRPQEVILELRFGADATGGEVLLEITGMASSFGPAFPSLPPSLAQGEGELRAPPVSAGEAAAARAPQPAGTRTVHLCGDVGDSALGARNDNDSAAVGSCQASPDSAEVRLRPPQTPLRWPPPPRLQELALPRLELDAAPGRLSPFTEGGARHLALRRLLATRPAVFAEPLDGCSALRVPAGAPFEDPKSYYEGRVVFVTRGSCLFLQKVHLLQRVWAAAAVVINHEGEGSRE